MTEDVLYGIRYERCYMDPKKSGDSDNSEKQEENKPAYKSPAQRAIEEIGHPWAGHVFVLDTESFTEIGHILRFGIYHVYGIDPSDRMALLMRGKLTREALDGPPDAPDGRTKPTEKGIFYNPETVTPEEVQTLKLYGGILNYRVQTVQEFVKGSFYRWVYYRRALCVGHNLAFDLARLATSFTPGRGYARGGFSLKLCDCDYEQCFNHPPVRIKHLDRNKRGYGFQSIKVPEGGVRNYRGAFLDTATLGRALLGPGEGSLEGLGRRFKAKVRKSDHPEHGGEITFDYLNYTATDVAATFSLYQAERDLYRQHNLSTPMTQIFSEASLGKAYLREFGVIPFMKKNPDFPNEIMGYGLAAFYGGRAEIRVRLEPVEVVYCDFKSQYPTVNAIMNLQELLLAEHVEVRECADETREWVGDLTPEKLLDRKEWPKLRRLVRVKPDGDLLSYRTDYGTGKQSGLPYLIDDPAWYALADVAASKILTGETPEILEAYELVPAGRQQKTNKVKLFGMDEFEIDLSRDDLFARVIDLRSDVKKRIEQTEDEGEKKYLEGLQLALKLLANATNYGVLLQITADERTEKPKDVTVWGANGRSEAKTHAVEKPGTYFAGPVGAFIPAGGRLLLALAEALGEREGLGYAFCDTDSIAFTRPEGMDRDTFRRKVTRITSLFERLSPYKSDKEILELEDINLDVNGVLQPLYFIGVSAKRYVLYNRNEDGTYTIRKFSSHGLGTWGELAEKSYVSPEWIPEPLESVTELPGYRRWIYDLWYQVIAAVESGDTAPDISKFDFPDDVPAGFQVTYTSPRVMDMYPLEGARPFSFFEVYPALDKVDLMLRQSSEGTSDDLSDLEDVVLYSAKGDRDHIRRKDTGEIADIEPKSMREQLRGFFTHPESKSGDPSGIGVLPRRHVVGVGRVQVGKTISRVAANASDLQRFGLVEGEQTYSKEYSLARALEEVDNLPVLAAESRISLTTLRRIRKGEVNPTEKTAKKILRAIERHKRLKRDFPEYGTELYIRDKDTASAFRKLKSARETHTWKELEGITGIKAKTLREFLRTGEIGKDKAATINRVLPVYGIGVTDYRRLKDKLLSYELSTRTLSDLLDVGALTLSKILTGEQRPDKETAAKIIGNVCAIEAYIADLETVTGTLRDLSTRHSRRDIARIVGVSVQTINDLLRGAKPKSSTLRKVKDGLAKIN